MSTDLEETLARELNEVAEALQVPPLPSLPSSATSATPATPATGEEERSASARLLPPLLVAAAVALVAGVLVLLLGQQGGGTPQPAPSPSGTSSPTGTASPTTAADASIPAGAPEVPFVLDRRLYVDGQQVPGVFDSVELRKGTWLARASDGTWWSGGPGRDTGPIAARIDQQAVLSPGGGYVGYLGVQGDRAVANGFDTQPAGEGFGVPVVELPRTEDGVAPTVTAVTDRGDVIVQSPRTSLMWRAQYQDQQTVVDLAETAPGQQVLADTPAGVVAADGGFGTGGAEGTAYLADLTPDGELRRIRDLPAFDGDLGVSPGGAWMLWAEAGTLGGEVATTGSLQVAPVDGGDPSTVTAPTGWAFVSGSRAWEDDRTFVAVVLPDATGNERLVRCSASLGRCRGLGAPASGEDAYYSAETALSDVMRAAAAGDRGLLLDPAVAGGAEWRDLVRYAAGRPGPVSGRCRDNGGGTKDCELALEARPQATYYVILEPARNAYGWRVGYVGQAEG